MSVIKNLLKGKKILVTGASSGIGREVAKLLSECGATLLITGRCTERLEKTKESLTGSEHYIYACDLKKHAELVDFMDSIFKRVGCIDALVHCAGSQITMPLKGLKEKHFDDLFTTNVKSSQFLAKEFRRKGRHNPNGSSIVFISSVAAFCGEPAISTYSASKSALLGLSKSLAIELSRQKIRVNCIAPGHVKTEMSEEFSKQLTNEQFLHISQKHPLGIGTARDIANSVLFLVSDLSSWVTGTTLHVDGGYSAH